MANFCKKCGSRLDPASGVCPNCDIPRPPERKPAKKSGAGLLIVLLTLLVVCVLGAVILYVLTDQGVVADPFLSDVMGVGTEAQSSEPTADGTVPQESQAPVLTVPDVTADTRENAVARLRTAGFAEPLVEELYDETIPAGQVISASIQAGEKAAPDTVITIFVSLGPAPFDLPDVAGRAEPDAVKTLEDLGLLVEIVYSVSADVPSGMVIDQTPAEGTAQFKGTTVTIRVSTGMEEAAVGSTGDCWVHNGTVSYYIPAGFGAVPNAAASGTILQTLYHPQLDMTIRIAGYTAEDLGGVTPLQRLEYDLANFDTSTRSVTYETKSDTWFVKSGYVGDTNYVYYDKEFVTGTEPDMLMHLSFTYPSESKDQCDPILTAFLNDLTVDE